jgi:hypothetical protein
MAVIGIAGFALAFVGGAFGTATIRNYRAGCSIALILRLRFLLATLFGFLVLTLSWSSSTATAAALAFVVVFIEAANPQFLFIAHGAIARAASIDVVRTCLIIVLIVLMSGMLSASLLLALISVVSAGVFTFYWVMQKSLVDESTNTSTTISLRALAQATLPLAVLGVVPKALDSGAVAVFHRLDTSGLCTQCDLYPIASRFVNIVPVVLTVGLTYCLAKGIRVSHKAGLITALVLLVIVSYLGGTLGGVEYLIGLISGDAVDLPPRLVFFAVGVAGAGVGFSTLQIGLVQGETKARRHFYIWLILCMAIVLIGEALSR